MSLSSAEGGGDLNVPEGRAADFAGRGVTVNAIAPGFITDRWWLEKLGQESYEKMVSSVEKSVPLNHAGTPEDMAEAALFLLGARNITGEVLISDAGMHLGGAPLIAR